MTVLDLFSAAAGGWSLGMHRAGFRTVAACEAVDWRRALYAQNNPGIPIYEDVRGLTASRLRRDLGYLPSLVVGSPPCQDISSANTKGKGVEGERSGLFFEAVRIIGEVRPRWFVLENSHNLRTRGADAVLAALEALGYACWPLVVRASDVGANHERPRCWLIGCDIGQVANAASERRDARPGNDQGDNARNDRGVIGDHSGDGVARETPDPDQARRTQNREACGTEQLGQADRKAADRAHGASNGTDAAEVRSERIAGGKERRQGKVAEHGDVPAGREMGLCAPDRDGAGGAWPLWSPNDLAGRLRLDDGLPARLAGTRIAVGGPRGTSAASLIVEAYGDAVIPQIPEAIGRAILRTEAALSAIQHRRAA